MIKHFLPAALVALIVGITSCNTKPESSKDVLIEVMDTSANPKSDFYSFAVGKWLKENPIPASESNWGVGNLVDEEIRTRLLDICNEAAKTKAAKGTPNQLIGDLWFTAMDSANAEKLGFQPLQPYLDMIDGIKTQSDLMVAIAKLKTVGIDVAYSFYVYQDLKKSDEFAVYLSQGGLGLPERDYYFNTDERTSNIRKVYMKYMADILTLLGSKDGIKDANSVFELEKQLATASRKLEDLRDDYANYNKKTTAELAALTPNIDWKSTFAALEIVVPANVIVGQPEFFQALNKISTTESLAAWKSYMKFQLADDMAPMLSSAFDTLRFGFRSRTMRGVTAQQPRWKRALRSTESLVGMSLGKLFVEKWYSPETKKRYAKLTNDVIAAYRESLTTLSWMSDSTRKLAIEKLNGIRVKVGYPEKWEVYKGLLLDRSSYAANVFSASKWHFDDMVNQLGKPVDHDKWDMTPQTYNAYYNPSNNEIVLPAAIFIVPGYKDEDLDDAIIYAYGGASTIGHEITHGFDDQGREYDKQGNLKNWWTKSDEVQFNARAERMVTQFNGYEMLNNLHVNGKATLGENIADLGGLVLGYEAFKKTEQYKSGKAINGLSPDKRFFLGYALAWMYNFRDEALANQLMTDVHAPAKLRVNGPISNMPEFYKAFDVKKGDKMYRDEDVRVKIW